MKILNIIKKKIFFIIKNFLIIIFLILSIYYIINIKYMKTNININIINEKRELYTNEQNQKTEFICENKKDLFLLYEKETFDNININNISLKDSTSLLLNYLDNKNKTILKKYIFSFSFQIFLVIFDIIIVFMWIVFCCFLYNEKCYCLFNKKKQNKYFKNISLLISISMYFIVILLNIFILFQFYSLIQNFDKSICSLFKIFYHTYYGEEKNYKIRPKWTGINEIKDLLQRTKNNLTNIIDRNQEIYDLFNNEIKNNFYYELNNKFFINNHFHNFCDLENNKVNNPNPLSDRNISHFLYCFDLLNLVQNEYNDNFSDYILLIDDLYNKLNSIDINKDKIQFSLDNAQNKLDSFVKILRDIEVEYSNNLNYILETIVHKYFIIIFYIFFILAILIYFSGFLAISSIACCKSKYCLKLYNLIWNFQMISLFITILLGAFFSLICVLIEDISMIIKYSIINDNMKINKTFSFSKSQYEIKGVNICIEGDGNLENYIQLNQGVDPLIHFYSMIKIIKDSLNNLINYKIILEKNEINLIFDELEEKPYLSKYQLIQLNKEDNSFNNESYLYPEAMLENILTKYTNDNNNQNIGNNSYYANYIFVYSNIFCNSTYNYTIINALECDNNCSYQKGKRCMILEDFPENNYFNGITIKNLDNINEENKDNYDNLYNLDELVKEFKKRYYDIDNGFKTSFKKLLNNSRQYLFKEIKPKYYKLKNTTIEILKIIDDKINIIRDIYEEVIGKNNTSLSNIFNCKYLKRDVNIFLNLLEINLYHSFIILIIYTLSISLCSFISILFSIFFLKLDKYLKNNISTDKNKSINETKDINILEKPKIRTTDDKYSLDSNLKTNINEKTGLKKSNTNISNIKNVDNEKNNNK